MSKNKPTILKEFDINPYPRKLWIAYGKDDTIIKDKLVEMDGTPLDFTDDYAIGFNGLTTSVKDKEKGLYGVLVWIIKYDSIGTFAHEADHVCSQVFKECGVNMGFNGNDEHHAYLIGWVTDKIYETIKNK